MSTKVLGLQFAPFTLEQLAQLVTSAPAQGGVSLVCTANVDHVVNMSRDAELRAAYDFAKIVTADGTPVYAYVKLRGGNVPERVTGSDLFVEIMRRLDPARHRPIFLAGRQVTADAIGQSLIEKGFDPKHFIIEVPPFGFENDAAKSGELASKMRGLGATHIFFGVGSPKSEVWIYRHRDQLGNAYAFGFGAGLDYYAQSARRAPVILQKLGCEWLWRLAMEPRRLARRYLVNSWQFLIIVAGDLFRSGDLGVDSKIDQKM